MKKQDKCTGWAIVATIERSDGTWYDETILDIDDDTASSVDEFLTDYIKEKNEESNEKGYYDLTPEEIQEEEIEKYGDVNQGLGTWNGYEYVKNK